MKRSGLAALGWLLVAACAPHPPPTPPRAPTPPPPAPRIPPGCEASLEGAWIHQSEPTWSYRAVDDGGTLVLWPRRRGADGGAPASADGGTRVVLTRSPEGFVGSTRAQAFTAGGQGCAVEFPTEVIACGDGGLWLRSAASTTFDEQCQPPAHGPVAPRVEHRLVTAPASDGGAPP